ncbi:unnamed protein product [Umbelopsis ramanniana]
MPHMPFLSSRVFGTSPPSGAIKLQDRIIQHYTQHGRRRSSSQSSRKTCGSNENDSLEDSTTPHQSHRLSHIIAKHFAKKQEVVQEHEIDFPKELEKLREIFDKARSETDCATVSRGSVYYQEDYIDCEKAMREMTEAWSILMDLVDRDTWRENSTAENLDMDIKMLIDDFAGLPRVDLNMDDDEDDD